MLPHPHKHRHALHARLVPVTLWLSLGAAVLLSGCSSENSSDSGGRRPSGATTVVTEAITEQPLIETIQAVGTARALHSVVLYPEAAGIVRAVHFTANMTVEAGDTLLELDNRDELLAVKLAEVQLADAERLVRRYKQVNQQDANLPQSQIDAAIAAADTAEITLDQARVALDRRFIRAPFSGVVGITEIDSGDRIDSGTQVTTLDDRSQLLVNFAVPEVYVSKIRTGTPVDVRLWDGADQPLRGEIIAVDSRIDPTSRAFTARAAINNTTDRYRPGMAFEISVRAERGIFRSVPDVAVQWGADGAYIWIEEDGKAARRDVQLVKRRSGEILIEADIPLGTRVITEGVQAVRAGASLRDLNPVLGDDPAARTAAETQPVEARRDNG
ncbi:MAG: efflux RND transporter periplasmic adaptor subunit [Luminiphilus sp.]|nr:efflux RND transporter periplasmic adaptor subunit [Luminiphilus sp.]